MPRVVEGKPRRALRRDQGIGGGLEMKDPKG
jgi:hypothetical protein